MDEMLEGQEPQKTPEGEGTPVTPTGLTPEEIVDLKHKAAVSSQNFERAKKAEEEKKLLEEQLRQLQESTVPSIDDVFSDEGKVLKGQISSLESEIKAMREERQLEAVFTQYPALKDKRSEFDTFRAEYPQSKLENVAKLFLVENGLLETPKPERKGLEGATGGRREAQSSGLSADEVKKLRETNYKKYRELLLAGKIDMK